MLMRHLGRLSGYDEKSAIDLVTAADRESEAAIAADLTARFPEDRLVLEETDGREGAAAKRSATDAHAFTWCVDPLDGTTNFVHGFPSFAISLGLLHHGEPVLGVVSAPAMDERYLGGVGITPERNGQRIAVSRVPTLSRALLATGFPYDRRTRVDALLRPVRKVLLSAHDLRRCGSAALDLCHVAAGCLDGFFEEGLSPWDTAAGRAIVEAAGGRLSDYHGRPHSLYGPSIVASNGLVHDELLAILESEGPPAAASNG